MNTIRLFTLDDTRSVNQKIINKEQIDISKLSSISQKLIRETVLTAKEINDGFAEAKKELIKN